MEHALVEREGLYMTVDGKKTYAVADIEALLEGERAELIDGEMFMMAAPALIHQDMLLWLTVKIGSYVMAHKGPCKVVPAPFAVYVKDDEYKAGIYEDFFLDFSEFKQYREM